MRERLARFMQGRYGIDPLSRFLMVVGLILLVISCFIRDPKFAMNICYLAAWVILIIAYGRALSGNHTKRSAENARYCQFTGKVKHALGREKYMMEQRKDYRIFTCPGCSQKIRIPKGRGKIEISCPKCGTKFVKKA